MKKMEARKWSAFSAAAADSPNQRQRDIKRRKMRKTGKRRKMRKKRKARGRSRSSRPVLLVVAPPLVFSELPTLRQPKLFGELTQNPRAFLPKFAGTAFSPREA